jgi:translation initiation factor 1
VTRERSTTTRLAYSTGGEVEPEAPEAPPAARPGKGGIRLRLERRAAGRLVTVVTGLPGTPPQAEELGKALRRAAHAGGTFRDGVLELQGDQRERVEAELKARGLSCKRAGG